MQITVLDLLTLEMSLRQSTATRKEKMLAAAKSSFLSIVLLTLMPKLSMGKESTKNAELLVLS